MNSILGKKSNIELFSLLLEDYKKKKKTLLHFSQQLHPASGIQTNAQMDTIPNGHNPK